MGKIIIFLMMTCLMSLSERAADGKTKKFRPHKHFFLIGETKEREREEKESLNLSLLFSSHHHTTMRSSLCCRIQSTFTFPNTLILLCCCLLLSLFSLRAISHHHHQSVVMNTHAEKGRQTQREGEEEGRRNQAEEKASSFTFITSNNNDVPPLFVQYEVYPKCAEEQIERNVKLFQKNRRRARMKNGTTSGRRRLSSVKTKMKTILIHLSRSKSGATKERMRFFSCEGLRKTRERASQRFKS